MSTSPPTLNEQLRTLGYTTASTDSPERLAKGDKHILLDGHIVFTGASGEVWAWLHETAQIPPATPREPEDLTWLNGYQTEV